MARVRALETLRCFACPVQMRQSMARVAWLAVTAILLMIVPSNIAQEGCTVTVRIPVTGASATISMVRITLWLCKQCRAACKSSSAV